MTTQQGFERTMAHHPDISELRARYDQATDNPMMQAVEGLLLLGGGYAAISPWVTGFSLTEPSLAVSNLVTGIAVMVVTLACAASFGRMHGLAWVAPVMGAWLIVSTWVISGVSATTGTIVSNIVAGAAVIVFGMLMMGMTRLTLRRR